MYDWEKELKACMKTITKRFLIQMFFMAVVPVFILYSGQMFIETVFKSADVEKTPLLLFEIARFIIVGVAILTFLTLLAKFVCSYLYVRKDINNTLYNELQDRADELEKSGNSGLKQEVKQLKENQGGIKGYQYIKLIKDFSSEEES